MIAFLPNCTVVASVANASFSSLLKGPAALPAKPERAAGHSTGASLSSRRRVAMHCPLIHHWRIRGNAQPHLFNKTMLRIKHSREDCKEKYHRDGERHLVFRRIDTLLTTYF